MFKSKRRAINIPQVDHSYFAGHLASQIGNDRFAAPPLPHDALVRGVALHDWGYLPLDAYPLLDMTLDEWLAVAERGADRHFSDPVVDIIVKLHIRRLALHDPIPVRQVLVDRIDAMVAERVTETPYDRALFDRIDRLTRFCDMIAFFVCFEEQTSVTLDLYADYDSDDPEDVTCTFDGQGGVIVEPWPFAVPVITGLLPAYQRDGYPDWLEPVVVPYRVWGGRQAL